MQNNCIQLSKQNEKSIDQLSRQEINLRISLSGTSYQKQYLNNSQSAFNNQNSYDIIGSRVKKSQKYECYDKEKKRKISEQIAKNQLLNFGKSQTPKRKTKTSLIVSQNNKKQGKWQYQSGLENNKKGKIFYKLIDKNNHKRIHSSQKSLCYEEEQRSSKICHQTRQVPCLSNIEILKIHAERLQQSNVLLGKKQGEEQDLIQPIQRKKQNQLYNFQYHLHLSHTIKSNRQKNKHNFINKKLSSHSSHQYQKQIKLNVKNVHYIKQNSSNQIFNKTMTNMTVNQQNQQSKSLYNNNNEISQVKNCHLQETKKDIHLIGETSKKSSFCRAKTGRTFTQYSENGNKQTNYFQSKQIKSYLSKEQGAFKSSSRATKSTLYKQKCRYVQNNNQIHASMYPRAKSNHNKSQSHINYIKNQSLQAINNSCYAQTHNNQFIRSSMNNTDYANSTENSYVINNQFVSFGSRSALDKNRQNIKKIGKNINKLLNNCKKRTIQHQVRSQNKTIDEFIKTKISLLGNIQKNKKNIISSHSLCEDATKQLALAEKQSTGKDIKIKDQIKAKSRNQVDFTLKSNRLKTQYTYSKINAERFYKNQIQKHRDNAYKNICDPHLKTKSIDLLVKPTKSKKDIVIICL